MKKVISSVLVMVMLLSFSVGVYGVGARTVDYPQTYLTYIKVADFVFALEHGQAIVNAGMDSRAGDYSKIIGTIQKRQNGSWVDVKSFSTSEKALFVVLDEAYYVASDNIYRGKFQFLVYENNKIVESVTEYMDP